MADNRSEAMAQTKEADGKPQAEAVGKPQKRVADNKSVSKPVTDEDVAGRSNASDNTPFSMDGRGSGNSNEHNRRGIFYGNRNKEGWHRL